jgi:membrane-bound lytic murein transglycosylase B
MKATALLTALLSILLAGCELRGKPAKSAVPPAAPKPVASAAPAPAPPPALSIPQTRVELPKPQPVDPAALETEATPPEPPPAVAAPARSRRATPAASQPAPASPPAATPPPEPRETVQEIVSPAEVKRLQDQAQARRNEVKQILDRLGRRQLTGTQRNVVATIRNFLTLSGEAENHNDMRQADALAERAQILAKELQSGK